MLNGYVISMVISGLRVCLMNGLDKEGAFAECKLAQKF